MSGATDTVARATSAAATHVATHAIIMAAGIGKRMQPLTLETPKPLVEVNGVRMIDTVIGALHEMGIEEIYVVVGHLAERFAGLPAQYPGLTLIENPYFDTCNNISSLYVAREHLGNCIILDGDQVVRDPSALDPHFDRSGYNAVWCEGETDEWLLEVEGGIVRSCSRTGGRHGWQLFSVSRWTEEDGRLLRRHLEQEFEGGNRQIYWDDVALFCHPDEYELGIKKMGRGDVVEIDSLVELAAIDPRYGRYL
ncbi:MAG: phosphocholine cytidylyltransferase family protein [Olsenella sp.]|nr:phosphocholine cytidylyltransferase family protein [Olsenella sp.]